MRTLSNREKLTIRIAAVGISIYLLIFFGLNGAKNSNGGQGSYLQLLEEAEKLKTELKPYDDRAARVKRLMDEFHMEPAKLSRASVVAQASSAIQKTAASGGVQLGPIRESAGRASNKELGSIKLEGSGQLPSVMSFLQRLQTLGYPLIIDSVQLSADKGPGLIKLSLTITILDFEAWKKGGPNA